MSDIVDKLKTFFDEHPLHSFTVEAIAEYFGMSKNTDGFFSYMDMKKIKSALEYLWFEGLVEVRYQKAPSTLKDLKVNEGIL